MTGLELPFPKKMRSPISYTLREDLFTDQWIIPKETIIKLDSTQNFGWVFLPVNCQDKRGFTIPRRIFRY